MLDYQGNLTIISFGGLHTEAHVPTSCFQQSFIRTQTPFTSASSVTAFLQGDRAERLQQRP